MRNKNCKINFLGPYPRTGKSENQDSDSHVSKSKALIFTPHHPTHQHPRTGKQVLLPEILIKVFSEGTGSERGLRIKNNSGS